jgi:hypothetical protein
MKLRLFLLAGAVALATTMSASAEPSDREVSVGRAQTLQISVTGDVVAVPDPLLKVVRAHATSGGRPTPLQCDVVRTGRVLELTITGPGRSVLPFAAASGGYAVEVRYPPALHLRVREFSGTVSVPNPQSAVEIYDAAGAISVDGARGSVTAQADRGDIAVTGAHSTIELTTGTGDIDALLAPGWRGNRVRLEAETGNVQLAVPAGFRGRFDATVGTGRLMNALRSQPNAPLVFALVETGDLTISVERK